MPSSTCMTGWRGHELWRLGGASCSTVDVSRRLLCVGLENGLTRGEERAGVGVWDAPGPNWRPAAVCGSPWPAVGALRCEEPQTYRGRVPSVSHPSRSSRRSCSSGLVRPHRARSNRRRLSVHHRAGRRRVSCLCWPDDQGAGARQCRGATSGRQLTEWLLGRRLRAIMPPLAPAASSLYQHSSLC